jgi:hypothetical protein
MLLLEISEGKTFVVKKQTIFHIVPFDLSFIEAQLVLTHHVHATM